MYCKNMKVKQKRVLGGSQLIEHRYYDVAFLNYRPIERLEPEAKLLVPHWGI
jgi:hypothetical protein